MAGYKTVVLTLITAVALSATGGCHFSKPYHFFRETDGDQRYCVSMATSLDQPDMNPDFSPARNTSKPRTIRDAPPTDFWALTLEECIKMALTQNKVLHDLGGRVIQSPTSISSVYDVALQESNPLTGVEGALSAFDAAMSTSMFWEHNDRALNNLLLGGGTRLFHQDRDPFQFQIAKTAATGGQFFVRNNTLFDRNNAPANLFPSYYDTNIEVEARQPLLQGGGVDFNRIVGPQSTNGYAIPTGVSIARIRTDISLTDFEESVRALVSDVENAYWDLYYAYRDLDAKIATRDQALETWRAVNAQLQAGSLRGDADREAQAREQYLIYEALVQDALSGTPRRQTQSGLGSSGGTFQGAGGVYAVERRLRYLLGLPVADDRVIRPADEPSRGLVVFDWDEVLRESLARRVELRRQKWRVKEAELGLVAAKNYLLPRLDASALYQWRGFGQDLVRQSPSPDEFNNAVQNLLSGQFQESQVGFNLNVPLGFRQGHAAVRNAELLIAREKALLADQERLVATELAAAVAEVDRAFAALNTQYNRRLAAEQQARLIQQKYANPPADRPVPIEFLLDAQRRKIDADLAYQRALVEYNLAIKNVHFEKGSLLDYNEVRLAEGPWPKKAYKDAEKRQRERAAAKPIDYTFTAPNVVALGPLPQITPKDNGPGISAPLPPPAEPIDTPAATAPTPSPAPSATPTDSPKHAPAESLPAPAAMPTSKPRAPPPAFN